MPPFNRMQNQPKVTKDETTKTPQDGGILYTHTVVTEWLVMPEHFQEKIDAVVRRKADLEAEEAALREDMEDIPE